MTERLWSVHEVAQLSGTTTRALRHYDTIGLLPPTSRGDNGYRFYDQHALVRLQRIVILRQFGLGLVAIGDILRNDQGRNEAEALASHLVSLRNEHERLARQIVTVQTTLENLTKGHQLMAENMFDGFDHTTHRDEVERRWGAETYASGDAWWRNLGAAGRDTFMGQQRSIHSAYLAAFEAGLDATNTEVQAITAELLAWVTQAWQGATPTAAQFTGLGALYETDERFGKNFGGARTAAFVSAAMAAFSARELAR